MNSSSDIIILQGSREKAKGIRIEVNSSEPILGEGNFGVVRKGVLIDERNGARRDVAVKFLYDDLSDKAISRARKEASINIVHDNLVEMLGFVQTENVDYNGIKRVHYHVVSELLDGVMLYDLLTGTVTNSEGREVATAKMLYSLLQNDRVAFAKHITSAVLEGIKALHGFGYIHRDIDPSNIMITSDGKLKLIDLGIAKSISAATNEARLTSTGDFVGKAAYAAPELVRGDIDHQDVTTDVYAIGIMLYQLTTGTLPFSGAVNNILKQQINDDVPVQNIPDKKLRGIVKKATQKDQLQRYQSAQELLDALEGNDVAGETTINAPLVLGASAIAGIVAGALIGLFI